MRSYLVRIEEYCFVSNFIYVRNLCMPADKTHLKFGITDDGAFTSVCETISNDNLTIYRLS